MPSHITIFLPQARLQLESLFDETNYDVASALVPLALSCRLVYAKEEEAQAKEMYYLTLAATMCEQLGAINDPVYHAVIRFENTPQLVQSSRLISS